MHTHTLSLTDSFFLNTHTQTTFLSLSLSLSLSLGSVEGNERKRRWSYYRHFLTFVRAKERAAKNIFADFYFFTSPPAFAFFTLALNFPSSLADNRLELIIQSQLIFGAFSVQAFFV